MLNESNALQVFKKFVMAVTQALFEPLVFQMAKQGFWLGAYLTKLC